MADSNARDREQDLINCEVRRGLNEYHLQHTRETLDRADDQVRDSNHRIKLSRESLERTGRSLARAWA